MQKINVFAALLMILAVGLAANRSKPAAEKRPNILFVISDDQSYPHTGAYGDKAARTPHFDRVAREGILFTNAFAASPGCSPSRAALLTGLNCWQIKEAGTHASSFPAEFQVFPDLLEKAGYAVGFTGKGWGPGDFKASGRNRNPAGNAYLTKKQQSPKGISEVDYAGNFKDFFEQKESGKPFFFWLGTHEPHRTYQKGIGVANGFEIGKVQVPPFLPDVPEVRSDMLDYLYEIQWFDTQLGKVMAQLEQAGELDNTLIVVTADNGMSFPRAKANVYEYGIHVPLAVRWGNEIPKGVVAKDIVSLVDLYATFLEVGKAGSPSYPTESKSLLPLLKTGKGQRIAAFASRERHSSSRYNNMGYPQRSIRTDRYLFIRNYKPERWPAGDPTKLDSNGKLEAVNTAFHDIDESADNIVIRDWKKPEIAPFFHLAVDKRPAEEFYDVIKDPGCLNNLIHDKKLTREVSRLRNDLKSYQLATKDPREMGNGDYLESFPRLNGEIRNFPRLD
ncbi:sulfatase [Dyadobacter sp. Leaf189]|uniref:sulfatase family protein n=1 Tax=Dyadobacter sp. Leaf189 TaxID=1736295 RepID=UPI0006F8D771|nr:sulfatase [Dyadobacter sp. Leaf189]KQS26640.1 heparan N-sulfatase [Dyadobacter sp. Leaf189]